tara:strand:+ start:26 stop:820 length:795 start_codon:yes stop_codon:yes gene_type:complete
MNNYSISNSDNYQEFIEEDEEQIIKKYISIINEFFITYSNHENRFNNNIYIINAIDSLTHIFLNLLLYTNNLDLTYHNTQRALYYYIEFISQISDDEHSFLNLSSHDAKLFIYKKTIYEIDQEYKRKFKQHKKMVKIFNKLTLITNINKALIKYNIINFNLSEHAIIFDSCYTQIIGHLIHLSLTHTKDVEMLKIVEDFILKLYYKNHDYNKFSQLVFHFIKKIYKLDDIDAIQHSINKKFMHNDFDAKSCQLTHIKFISWMLA